MANPVPVTYSSPVPKVAGGRHSADLAIDYDIDAGNINNANRVIEGRASWGRWQRLIDWLFRGEHCQAAYDEDVSRAAALLAYHGRRKN